MQTNSQSNTLPQVEAQLIEAARAGEIIGLVEHLYQFCQVRAVRLVGGFQAAYGARLEVEDVAQEGIERVLRSLAGALACDRPIARLMTSAQGRMLQYCQEQRGPIRVPHVSQWRGARVPVVSSLDAIVPGTDDLRLLDLLPAEACHV